MCGESSKNFLRRLGAFLLVSLLALFPCYSLTEEEEAELTEIYKSLENSWKSTNSLLQEQESIIQNLKDSLILQEQGLTSLRTDYNQVRETQMSLSESIRTLEENSAQWEKPLDNLESSLKSMEKEVAIYKWIAIGSVIISVSAVGFAIPFLLNL